MQFEEEFDIGSLLEGAVTIVTGGVTPSVSIIDTFQNKYDIIVLVMKMEDKTFELLTKMYGDFSKRFEGVENEIGGINNKIGDINNKIGDIESEIKHVGNQVTKLENSHGKKLDALFDGFKQLAEGQEEIKAQIADIAVKVEKHDVEITVIKGGKHKKAL